MEGERKRRGDGLGLMLALIRDSFFFRLSAALGNAIQRGARESLLVRWWCSTTPWPAPTSSVSTPGRALP